MPEPFKLRVLRNLVAELKTIRPANGYTSDLSSSVFMGRTEYGDTDPLPMLSILEPPVAPDQLPQPRNSSVTNGDWDLLLQGFCQDDHNDPTVPAYKLMAEVHMCLAMIKHGPEAERAKTGKSVPILGIQGVDDMRIGTGVVRPPDEISAKAYFWLNITLGITEDYLQPYS